MDIRLGDTTWGAQEPTGGGARRLSALTVRVNGYSEWIAISRKPAVVGESVIVEVNDSSERPEELATCVIESRPFVVDGDTRHWIRLMRTDLSSVLFEQQIRRS
jgi:hypothetical protein